MNRRAAMLAIVSLIGVPTASEAQSSRAMRSAEGDPVWSKY
jgi:hypothetical protein